MKCLGHVDQLMQLIIQFKQIFAMYIKNHLIIHFANLKYINQFMDNTLHALTSPSITLNAASGDTKLILSQTVDMISAYN